MKFGFNAAVAGLLAPHFVLGMGLIFRVESYGLAQVWVVIIGIVGLAGIAVFATAVAESLGKIEKLRGGDVAALSILAAVAAAILSLAFGVLWVSTVVGGFVVF